MAGSLPIRSDYYEPDPSWFARLSSLSTQPLTILTVMPIAEPNHRDRDSFRDARQLLAQLIGRRCAEDVVTEVAVQNEPKSV